MFNEYDRIIIVYRNGRTERGVIADVSEKELDVDVDIPGEDVGEDVPQAVSWTLRKHAGQWYDEDGEPISIRKEA